MGSYLRFEKLDSVRKGELEDDYMDEIFAVTYIIIKMTLLSKWSYYCYSFLASKIMRLVISHFVFGHNFTLINFVDSMISQLCMCFLYWFLNYE